MNTSTTCSLVAASENSTCPPDRTDRLEHEALALPINSSRDGGNLAASLHRAELLSEVVAFKCATK